MKSKASRSTSKLSAAAAQLLQREYICCAYSRLGVLKASGDRVTGYLHSQITQDIRLLSGSRGIYGCVLTPQGKPVADLHVIQGHGGELLMLTEASRAEALVGRLRQFSLGYDIRLGIVDKMCVLSVQGPGTDAALRQAGLPVPEMQAYATASLPDQDIFALRMAESASTGVWLALPNADAPLQLDEMGNAVPETELEAARVLCGVPRFGLDWDEGVHPLNANLIERDGVSFDKGCYTGQEVTSRMHWRGGIKWRLYRVCLDAAPPSLPCPVQTAASIGTLTSLALDPEGHYFGIARLRIDTVNSGAPLFAENDIPLQVLGACQPE